MSTSTPTGTRRRSRAPTARIVNDVDKDLGKTKGHTKCREVQCSNGRTYAAVLDIYPSGRRKLHICQWVTHSKEIDTPVSKRDLPRSVKTLMQPVYS